MVPSFLQRLFLNSFIKKKTKLRNQERNLDSLVTLEALEKNDKGDTGQDLPTDGKRHCSPVTKAGTT